MEVFADASYFIALLNRRDEAHVRALDFSKQPGLRFVTTEWVFAECADGFSARPELRAVVAEVIRDTYENPAARVIPATHESFRDGFDLFRARADKAWSLTDCISFAVMRGEGLTEALTTDRHFTQAGFRTLLTDDAS
ncbi:MAG: PIN domain-containing protein [Phycisphaera sp.]|nr:PIN domain-containing protein [Phycisphaera sp.]